ncbi:hypothetical protein ACIA8K_38925 [Catenuloplanes sp. NPDC051500]|uniref:hypothetical protein n=1 Tax=Catenuloplanes sp. NPDC051500 TaxID=3363959 RepID=UPI0037BD7389
MATGAVEVNAAPGGTSITRGTSALVVDVDASEITGDMTDDRMQQLAHHPSLTKGNSPGEALVGHLIAS